MGEFKDKKVLEANANIEPRPTMKTLAEEIVKQNQEGKVVYSRFGK